MMMLMTPLFIPMKRRRRTREVMGIDQEGIIPSRLVVGIEQHPWSSVCVYVCIYIWSGFKLVVVEVWIVAAPSIITLTTVTTIARVSTIERKESIF